MSLDGKSLWDEFCRRGTEMIVNRAGRLAFLAGRGENIEYYGVMKKGFRVCSSQFLSIAMLFRLYVLILQSFPLLPGNTNSNEYSNVHLHVLSPKNVNASELKHTC